MRRLRGALGIAALTAAAGACSSILGLDGVEFDDDGNVPVEHCGNQALDGDESGVDCGGSCAKCEADQPCNGDADCQGGVCEDGVCAASCDDGEENGEETGVDCGGDCPPCPGTEDCTQRGDEDGNSLADCLDPVCWDSQCIELPDGWLGPVTLVDTAAKPGCPEGWQVPFGDAYTALSATEAECAPCVCGPPAAGTCADVVIELYADEACAAQQDTMVATGLCQTVPNGIDSILVPEVPYLPAGCPASGGELTAPEPVWSGEVSVCMGTPLGDCAAGPCTPPLPPGAPVCILQVGEADCPEPWSDRRPLYEAGGEVDERSCSACACDVPAGGTCSAQISLYQSTMCAFTVDQIMSSPACHDVGANIEAFRRVDLDPPPSPVCTPIGGVPMGSVEPGEPGATACCLPPQLTP